MTDYRDKPSKSSPPSDTPHQTTLHIVPEEIDLLADAFSRCKSLAESKNILVKFLKELKLMGLVGEKRNAAILFLAMISRLLDKPVSIAVKGQSSAGKSNLVDLVLSFFPPNSFYSSTALSDTALIHEEESLQHKILVIHELAGVGDKDSKALYFLRQLMSGGSITYRVVQEKAKGGHVTVKKEQQGPVTVITTTTLVNLLVDIETRFFSISVNESKHSSRAICATYNDGEEYKSVDVVWTELQNWLKLATTVNGPYRVNVPYVKAIVDLMPERAFRMVRIRRDFKSFVGLIKAHAVLHQANREKKNGKIQANFDDYEPVRTVIGEIFAASLCMYVPEHIRRVVDAVGLLCPNTVQWTTVLDLADYLNLDPRTIRRSVSIAMKDDYLREVHEFRSGLDNRKLKITTGKPMPDSDPVLPTRQVLENYYRSLF